MNISFKNFKISFSSDCCSESVSSDTKHGDTTCQSHAPQRRKIPAPLLGWILGHPDTANATTITIGNKWIGRMNDKQQYKELVKAIRTHINKRDKLKKYLYVFEHTQAGQLHAHGIEFNTWQANFIESFQKFGSRNAHDASFQRVADRKAYMTYIDKEHAFPFITNIRKHEVKNKIYSNIIKTCQEKLDENTESVTEQSLRSSDSQSCPTN